MISQWSSKSQLYAPKSGPAELAEALQVEVSCSAILASSSLTQASAGDSTVHAISSASCIPSILRLALTDALPAARPQAF